MTALCPGSFDPITLGHIDIIRRAHAIFGDVIVAVGRNSTKLNLFSLDERLALAREALADLPGVRVMPLDGLLARFAVDQGASVLVKGLRFASEFDYELQMAHINRAVTGIETVLLPASAEFGALSSTMLREVASLGGDVSGLVTPAVGQAIKAKLAQQTSA